jgi:hypothetical protein
MTIFVTCECGKVYQLSDNKAGKRATCKKCGNSLQIPNAGEVSDAPVPSTGDNSGKHESLNSWDDVRAFILSEFSGSIQDDDGESLTIVKSWEDGRGQMVIVSSIESKTGVPWIAIKSPVGILPVEILPRVCESLSGKVCGGLIKLGDRYWIRYSMPIGDTSQDELVFPLENVAGIADVLEETYVGGDAQ